MEHDLKNIEKAILAGVVGETTGVLLRDREAKRTALRQQLERWQQREKVSPYIPISAEAIRARLEGLDELLRRDPCRVNAFFRDHLSPIMCEPVQEAGQRFYRARGAMKGSAVMTALGLDQDFVFGGCGGGI